MDYGIAQTKKVFFNYIIFLLRRCGKIPNEGIQTYLRSFWRMPFGLVAMVQDHRILGSQSLQIASRQEIFVIIQQPVGFADSLIELRGLAGWD